jgi:hypothetical protein
MIIFNVLRGISNILKNTFEGDGYSELGKWGSKED